MFLETTVSLHRKAFIFEQKNIKRASKHKLRPTVVALFVGHRFGFH